MPKLTGEVQEFKVVLHYVDNEFHTEGPVMFSEQEPVKVTFTVLAVIDYRKPFAARKYSVHSIVPDKPYPHLTRQGEQGFMVRLRAELARMMYPYPCHNFGIKKVAEVA